MHAERCSACRAKPVKQPSYANVIRWWCGSFKYLDGMRVFVRSAECQIKQQEDNNDAR